MICSLDLSQHTKKFEKRKFVLSGSSNGPLYIWTQTTFVGRRWGREHGRIGADVRLLYGKRKMKGREVNVLKRREAGEITQSLIFRNRKRAKGSKPGKKCGSQECKAVEAEDLDPLFPPPPPCSPPRTLDSISHFESAHVLCQIALRDGFEGRSLTQFLVHPRNREVKSLSQVVKVANFLDLNKSWSCKHSRGKKKKLTRMILVHDFNQ